MAWDGEKGLPDFIPDKIQSADAVPHCCIT